MNDFQYGSGPILAYGYLGTLRNSNDRNHSTGDDYPVYVNGDFVGYRESVAVGDRGGWHAVDDYLKSRNFVEYTITSDGFDVYIDANDTGIAEGIKNNLEVYLNIR